MHFPFVSTFPDVNLLSSLPYLPLSVCAFPVSNSFNFGFPYVPLVTMFVLCLSSSWCLYLCVVFMCLQNFTLFYFLYVCMPLSYVFVWLYLSSLFPLVMSLSYYVCTYCLSFCYIPFPFSNSILPLFPNCTLPMCLFSFPYPMFPSPFLCFLCYPLLLASLGHLALCRPLLLSLVFFVPVSL